MALRITKETDDDHKTVLKVDGRLTAGDVEVLARTVESVAGMLTLDLSDLQSADQEGVAILRDLVSLGAEVRGASPYIELLLKPRL